jgi:hypothetical protein
MTQETIESPVLGMGPVARVLRGLLAVLIVAATVQSWGGNALYYFTILSNLGAVILLAGEAIWPRWMRSNAFYRGAVTVYMAITGMVYAVLLAPVLADVGDYAPWANFIHHSLAPAAILIDWLLFPPQQRLKGRAPFLWLLFPAAYFTFTLLRGPSSGFYPYPFLDPDQVGGLGGVAVYAVAVLALFVAVGRFVKWWAGRRGIIPADER